MNKHTPQSILERIQKENIKPKAKWYFVVQHAVLWVPGVLVTLLGAHAVAGFLYAFKHSGWEYREFIYASQKDFFIEAVPLIWVASLLLFSALIVKALRTTSSGYRFSLKSILFGSFFSSIFLGGVIYTMNELFETDSLIRYPIHMREKRTWFSPENGRLSGIIEEMNIDTIKIRDKDNVIWEIDMSGFGTTTFPFIQEGKSIRIIGTSTNILEKENYTFVACAVFPWEIGGFARQPLPPPKMARPPRIDIRNKNPDCTSVLSEIKQHIKRGERK